MKMVEEKIIKVIWKDARTLNYTATLEDIKKEQLAKCISVGYLVDENKERIAVCGFIFPEELVDTNMLNPDKKQFEGNRDTHLIPKYQIIKKIKLRELK